MLGDIIHIMMWICMLQCVTKWILKEKNELFLEIFFWKTFFIKIVTSFMSQCEYVWMHMLQHEYAHCDMKTNQFWK